MTKCVTFDPGPLYDPDLTYPSGVRGTERLDHGSADAATAVLSGRGTSSYNNNPDKV